MTRYDALSWARAKAMKRRSKAGGKVSKAGRPKTATSERRNAPNALRRQSSASVGDEIEIAQLVRERDEALEQVSAASSVLNVINSSAGDLQAVFAAILTNATHICQANFGTLYRFDGEKLHFAAEVGAPRDLAEFYKQRGPYLPPSGSHIERVVRTKRASQIADYTADAVPGPAAKFAHAGSTIWVPMLKDDVLVGVILVYRQEVHPFTDRQIALLQNFAAQAVIAIENTRLLNELRQRTNDLTESLERQTATSEVLRVISSSPGELEPVFQTMLENATRICDAKFGVMFFYRDGAIHLAAEFGVPKALSDYLRERGPYEPPAGTSLGNLIRSKQPVHTADASTEQTWIRPPPPVRLAGARAYLGVPMLKGDELIGAVVIYRQEVRPFTEKQVELVTSFAAQAVIAIENTRLLSELRQSLEQQTATADVLRVISSSPGELQPVFNAMLENAIRLCGAKFGALFRFDGEFFHLAAESGTPPEYAELLRRRGPFKPIPGSQGDRVLQSRQVNHTADYAAEAIPSPAATLGGARSTVTVPMLKDDVLIGVIIIYRQEVRPFTDKQIDLVKNFAAQAVIAIENARLLNELRQRTTDLTESLEQQTATSEVLSIISSCPGELEPVFQAILENATHICEANFGVLHLYEGGGFRIGATHNAPCAFAEAVARREPIFRPTPHHPLARVAATKQVVQVADLALDEAYKRRDAGAVRLVELAGARSLIAVPMLKDDALVGDIVIYRQEVRPFNDKQIALVTNFATQAVIAIENARLLNELRESLDQQTATSDVLRVISSSPGDLKPVFETVLQNATRICNANFGMLYRFDGERLHPAAQFNTPAALLDALTRRGPFKPTPGTQLDHVMQTKQVIHSADRAAGPNPGLSPKLGGARSQVTVPMLKDDTLVGLILIYRQEVRPFTEKQVELVQNFSAQAVIAIENARLLNELRESLEQQTATANVLRVISSSLGDLRPTFDALAENAARLCDGIDAFIQLREGDMLRYVAHYGGIPTTPPVGGTKLLTDGLVIGRAILEARIIHILDLQAETEEFPEGSATARQNGYRTIISVPLLRDRSAIGTIAVRRVEARLFSDKQVELLSNFAAQAVIAIENARLLAELRQRTDDLTESLEQQTATSEVLSVISSSPGELQPVFQAMLENATRLCEAKFGVMNLCEGDAFRVAAMHGAPPAYVEAREREPVVRHSSLLTPLARVVATKRMVHVADYAEEPAYKQRDPMAIRMVEVAGARTIIVVPMLKENELIGTLHIYRSEVRPFTDKQIALVQNFAAQAVIAIENTRLLNELRRRTIDLTESLESLRMAQDRLVQTEKLASLGQLTAGIAHEIKNPLNFVNNFSSVSVELIDELRGALGGIHLDTKVRTEISEIADTLQSNLDKIVQHGKRADAIVKNMLLHSRQGSGEHRPVDINALVEESLNLAYHGARAETQDFNITLERSFDPAAGEVDLFPQEITRVLLNLISNGFYAATKRKTETNGGDYEPILAAATKNLGHSVEIRIRDNGTGIPPDVKEKMFNPFFTTKPAGEGTGLGLSISHDIIVKQHGGSIEVDTKPGEFTEFRIVLPRKGASLGKSGDHA